MYNYLKEQSINNVSPLQFFHPFLRTILQNMSREPKKRSCQLLEEMGRTGIEQFPASGAFSSASDPEAIVTQGAIRIRTRSPLSPKRMHHPKVLQGILALHGREASLLEAVCLQAHAECVDDADLEHNENEEMLSMQHQKNMNKRKQKSPEAGSIR